MSPAVLNFASWRAATPAEVAAFLRRERPSPPSKRGRTRSLVVRSRLRPVDVYAYLRARFGQPNGFQNVLRRDDSDNWIHWDFNIVSDGGGLYVSGASREIHFLLDEALTDMEWQALILGLRAEFGRIGPQKAEMTKSFEKFVVFQNKYASLADVCAELHAKIVDIGPFQPPKARRPSAKNPETAVAPMRRASERAAGLYGATVQLGLLTPVLAEAFINMFILVLRRPELRDDDAAYQDLVRDYIPDRLARLSDACIGMRPVDRTTEAYRRFLTVMNKRNFAIHGNVDPEREAMETVYFEGKRPLFVETGHHLGRFFADLERLHRPDVVVADYEAVHGFLHELTTYLEPKVREFFEAIIDDPFPGYETRLKRVTRILPDQVMMAMMQGQRFDDDLKVPW